MGRNSLPRAFGRAIVVQESDDDGLSFFFQQTRFTHTFSSASSSSKKKQKPARPRQRAPARKGYKIWTEPEKDALTAGVKKYGPGATTPPQTRRRLFSSAPVVVSLKRTTPSFPGVHFGRFFLSFSLSLSLSPRVVLNRPEFGFESNRIGLEPSFPPRLESPLLNG